MIFEIVKIFGTYNITLLLLLSILTVLHRHCVHVQYPHCACSTVQCKAMQYAVCGVVYAVLVSVV